MTRRTRPVGRPKKRKSDIQKFSRLAVFPETHKIVKRRSKKDKKTMADWLDKKVRE